MTKCKKTTTEVSFTMPDGIDHQSYLESGYYPPEVVKFAAAAENVPKAHYYTAARLLEAEGPLSVAPYRVAVERIDGQVVRTFVWVKDNVKIEDKLNMAGFTIGGTHPGKWVGPGIAVKYTEYKKLVCLPDDFAASSLRWVDPGTGVCDCMFELHAVPRPMQCNNPACNKVDDPSKPKFKKCSRCLQVVYCSQECHKLYWPVHKHNCKRI